MKPSILVATLLMGCATAVTPPGASAPRSALDRRQQEPRTEETARASETEDSAQQSSATPAVAATTTATPSAVPALESNGRMAQGPTSFQIVDRMKDDGTMLYCAPDATPPCVRMKPPLLEKEQYESWARDTQDKRNLANANAKSR